MVTVVDSMGKVEIPRELQVKLGLTPGTAVDIKENGGVLSVKAAESKVGLVEENGMVVFYAELDPTVDPNEFNRQLREERSDKQMGL